MSQVELLPQTSDLPEGMLYQSDFLSADAERDLLARFSKLAFGEFKMHGVIAKRRVLHFGRDYQYQRGTIGPGAKIPNYLMPIIGQIGRVAGKNPEEFREVLLTHYPPGAGIGWHRDAPPFDIIAGISLLGECTMRLRPWPIEKGSVKSRTVVAQILEARSLYILRGPSRTSWQHHIPPTSTERFSVTVRTLRD